METGTSGSLLDEADFLAELATVEDGMTGRPRTYTSPSETLGPIRMRPHGKFTESDEPSADVALDGAVDSRSVLQRIAAAAMFVLMMAVGAAGAAVVFHERVARILAAW